MARVIQADKVIDAEEGDLRVWWIRNPPNPAEFTLVASPAEAAETLQSFTEADLHNRHVESNTGGLEVFEDDEWTEWYDDEGNDIDNLSES